MLLLFCIAENKRQLITEERWARTTLGRGHFVNNWKKRLLFIAWNRTATSPNSRFSLQIPFFRLRGLCTWGAYLSLSLHSKAKGQPWGMMWPCISVHRTVSAPARTRPINITLSSYLMVTSPWCWITKLRKRTQILSNTSLSMNMNDLCTPFCVFFPPQPSRR